MSASLQLEHPIGLIPQKHVVKEAGKYNVQYFK